MKISKTWGLIVLLIISAGVRFPGLVSRAIWYDESITLLETAGNAQPSWPQKPEPAKITKNQFTGTPSLNEIATGLYETDVHPPVYYWLLSFWRRWLGFSLEIARIFSLVCSIGAILVLYILLRVGKIEHPLVPALVFAISSGAVFAGHEARAYALTTLLIMLSALFAYLACDTNESRFRRVVYFTAMSLCGGIAFQTNYLALFPVLIILVWFLINFWSVSRYIAILAPLATVSIWLIGFRNFLTQLGSRPHQASGFPGMFPEIITIVKANLRVIGYGRHRELRLIFITILFLLLLASAIYIIRNWSKMNRKLLLLFMGLALAPSVGIFLLDLLFNKYLADTSRYFIFAGPALAVILTYGITKYRVTKFLLIILLGLQLVVVNWGLEKSPGWPGSNLRSLAGTIENYSSQSQIVVIGAGFGRGHVGSVIYELDPEVVIIVLDNDSNLEETQSDIQRYDDVWIVPSVDNRTASIENEMLTRLQESGYYTNISRQPAIHLWK